MRLVIAVAVEFADWRRFPLGRGCITARISGSEAITALLLEERSLRSPS